MDVQDQIFQVVVPTEDEIEIRDGQRRTVPQKIFPGYVLVEMILDPEDTWFVVRNTPGVTGFVGAATSRERSGRSRWTRPRSSGSCGRCGVEPPKVKVGFTKGQSVRIVDGPFADFVGTVDEINLERQGQGAGVASSAARRPVELDFLQVEKL